MRRRWPGTLALLALSTAVALGGAELFVRLYFDGKYGPRPAFTVPDDATVYRPAPDLDAVFHGPDWSMHVATDDFGARLGALGAVPPESELILMSGDSDTFGWGVQTAESCPSYLDALVAEESGRALRVVNLGMAGYGTLQSAHRLEQFVAARPEAAIRAVVFVHNTNDLRDNVRIETLGLMLGFLGREDRRQGTISRSMEGGQLSRSHLWNLARRAVQARQGRNEEGPGDAPPAAVGEGPSRRLAAGAHLPETFTLGSTTFRPDEFTAENTSLDAARARRAPSPIQRQAMKEAITAAHAAVGGRRLTIYHSYVFHAPDWFVDAVDAVIEECPDFGNRVVRLGRLPSGRLPRPHFNDHSGGHFTPAVNAAWARSLFDALLHDGGDAPGDPSAGTTPTP